jgi:hypothetical protein
MASRSGPASVPASKLPHRCASLEGAVGSAISDIPGASGVADGVGKG